MCNTPNTWHVTFGFGSTAVLLKRLWSHPTCWRYINKSIIIIIATACKDTKSTTTTIIKRCKKSYNTCTSVVDVISIILCVHDIMQELANFSQSQRTVQSMVSAACWLNSQTIRWVILFSRVPNGYERCSCFGGRCCYQIFKVLKLFFFHFTTVVELRI